MKEIVFPDEEQWEQLVKFITKDKDTIKMETAAIALAKLSSDADHTRLIVKKLLLPEKSDYLRRSAVNVCFSPKFMEKIYSECIQHNLHVVDVHDHYFEDEDVHFSRFDDDEQNLRWGPYVNRWFKNLRVGFVVFGKNPENLDARLWIREKNTVEPVDKLKIIGRDRMKLVIPKSSRLDGNFDREICDRTIRAVGEKVQKVLSSLIFSGIGGGGLASIFIELFARFGVRKINWVDDDIVTFSNLNRLLGATMEDAKRGTKKVQVLKREVLRINPNIEVVAIDGDFLTPEVQRQCLESDILFGFVDEVGSRFAANRLALTHSIPYFDLGCGGKAEDGRLVWARGQVIKVVPKAGFCLQCGNFFSDEKAVMDLMSKRELRAERNLGYVDGMNSPQLSVYAWNMLTSAWAAWFLLRYLSGDCPRLDGISTNLLSFGSRPWREDIDKKGKPRPPANCHICGEDGLWGCGDEVPFLLRQDDALIDDSSHSSIDEWGEREDNSERGRQTDSEFIKQITSKDLNLEKPKTACSGGIKGICNLFRSLFGSSATGRNPGSWGIKS
jgi:hypothetical protein